MNDSLDVQEIVEHIRQRARARLEGTPHSAGVAEEGTTPVGQRLRRVWQLLKWYSQHPEEFHSTITSRLVTARGIDELYVAVERLAKRFDKIEEIINAHIAPPE